MQSIDSRNSMRGWLFTDELIAKAMAHAEMLNPSIDLSNACNLNCAYCFIEEKISSRKLRKPNELTLTETIAVIDDFRNCGAKTINLVGAGEPTVDPHFEDIVKYIYGCGLTTVLFTNGIALSRTPELVSFLYKWDVSVVLKFNSPSPQTQDLVAGRRGYSQERDEALRLLLRTGFAATSPTRVALDTIVFKGNVETISHIHEWCRRNNVYPIVADFIPTGRTGGGRFEGFAALRTLEERSRHRVAEILQPISENERSHLVACLEQIDRRYGIGRPRGFAYYGGGRCTQMLGLYVDILGNIWPCVARQRKSLIGSVFSPLGNTRSGAVPSHIWLTDPYLKCLRESYDGGCPYKAPLVTLRRQANTTSAGRQWLAPGHNSRHPEGHRPFHLADLCAPPPVSAAYPADK